MVKLHDIPLEFIWQAAVVGVTSGGYPIKRSLLARIGLRFVIVKVKVARAYTV